MKAKDMPFLRESKHKQAGAVEARRQAFTHITLQISRNKTTFHLVESPSIGAQTISLRTILVIGKALILNMPVLTIREVCHPICKMVIITLKKSYASLGRALKNKLIEILWVAVPTKGKVDHRREFLQIERSQTLMSQSVKNLFHITINSITLLRLEVADQKGHFKRLGGTIICLCLPPVTLQLDDTIALSHRTIKQAKRIEAVK